VTKFRDPLDDPRAPVAGLQLADVLDLRAYERVRDDYRRQIIEHKRRRRIALGPIVTLLFESFDTVRFQVHEMARAERIVTDEGIEGELDAYNPLVPDGSNLKATLMIEYADAAEALAPYADYLMMNLSCPNTVDGRDFFADTGHLDTCLTALGEAELQLPVFLKVSPLGGVEAIERVLALDARGLWEVVRKEDISMCGFGPTIAMLTAAKLLGATSSTLVKYATSGDISGDRNMVVGYAGVTIS